jgi:ABC-type dipeptide/oligopeptide/nickel transport system permease subunit
MTRIDDLLYWQVFLLQSGDAPVREYVIVPRKMLELLEKDHTITKTPSNMPNGVGYKVPVDAVLLVSMSWVELDGTQPLNPSYLRNHMNLYRKQELAELLKAVKRLELSPTGRVPAQPPEPENLSRQQIEKLLAVGLKEPGVEPSKPSAWKPPAQVRTTVDVACMVDQATLQLFAGTSVGRDVADGCMFGLRNKLRIAKVKGG